MAIQWAGEREGERTVIQSGQELLLLFPLKAAAAADAALQDYQASTSLPQGFRAYYANQYR